MKDTQYNGWTNYATWRVNLEMVDGMRVEDVTYGNRNTATSSAYELGQALKEWAEDLISDGAPEGLTRDYALAFLSDVNWREIAQHLIDQNETEGAQV